MRGPPAPPLSTTKKKRKPGRTDAPSARKIMRTPPLTQDDAIGLVDQPLPFADVLPQFVRDGYDLEICAGCEAIAHLQSRRAGLAVDENLLPLGGAEGRGGRPGGDDGGDGYECDSDRRSRDSDQRREGGFAHHF